MARRAFQTVEGRAWLRGLLELLQRSPRWLRVFVVGWALCAAGWAGATEQLDQERAAFFEKRIRPVLVERCYECHSAESKKLKGGLRLDSKAGMLKGGDTKAAIVPGDAKRSLLIEAIGYSNPDLKMPPKGRLAESVVADFTQWVNDGAFYPREAVESPGAKEASNEKIAAESHWAFQPIRQITPPAATQGIEHPVDRFVSARLTERGLRLAPLADRRTLIRRAAYDLKGLPPTPEEIAGFLNDSSPEAFERMIEVFLASPHYGERWGRWWLDAARYADSNGQDENKVMANAWRYRDWVIRSFNSNQRFDAFITEQLAGDLLPTEGIGEETIFDRWTATGFLVLGPKMLAEQDKPKLVMDLVDEQIDTVSRAFLGLTVSCARCHDHKFDPIPTRDYYALAGIFRSTKTMANLEFVSKFNERRITRRNQLAAIEAHEKKVAAMTNEVKAAIQRADDALLADWRTNLSTYLAAAIKTNGTSSEQPTNAVMRLRELLALDPETNQVSRELHRLAADPDAIRKFLESDDNSLTTQATSGLRLTSGKVGAGFLATGRNHLEIPSAQELEPAELTVEAWVRASEFPKEGDRRRWLVAKNGNEWIEGHYALMLDGDRPGAYLNVGGGKENVFAVWSSKENLKRREWHHLAMTYDGATLRLFVDGKAAGETEINRRRVAGAGPLVLGRRPDGFVNFKGQLDEARVHRHALTATEIEKRFHPGAAVNDAVVATWEFNDLSEADRGAIVAAEVREALFGAAGVFTLPKDPRAHYPSSTREEIAALEKAIETEKAKAPAPRAFVLAVEDEKTVDLPVHIRGSHLNPGKEAVPRGFIRVAYHGEPRPLPKDRSGRLELAQWITSAENPLTARVIVNRVWQAHFGEGLVRTPDNFGVRGETPSHPELLDWLAQEFIRSGWDMKGLHRLILTSAAWRQSGAGAQKGDRVDPDNRLLWHYPRQRLEAEMIRDALLAVSARLDAKAGGSLVSWKNDEYTPKDTGWTASTRRSIYLPVVRDRVFDAFTIFDFANPSVGVAKRTPTVVSHQALFFLNSPLVKESARAFAKSLLAKFPKDPVARVREGYERALGRLPGDSEMEEALRFIEVAPRAKEDGKDEIAAWSAWCQVLFAANEFVYRE